MGDIATEPTLSVPVLLRERAARDPDGILIQHVDGTQITNAGFHTAAIVWADVFRSLGAKQDDCIVTITDPIIEGYACWIGICWAGCMEVSVNPELKGNLLVHAISDSKARIVVASAKYLDLLTSVIARLEHVQTIISIDDPGARAGILRFSDLAASASPVEHFDPGLMSPYGVIYTSGTTGPSKGVIVPWGSLQYAVMDRLFHGDDEVYHDPAIYSPWPMFHSSGRMGLAFAAIRDARLVIRPRLSVSSFWDEVRAFGCTHVHLIGVANFLFVQPEQSNDADNPLRRVLMNPVIAEFREFEKRFGVVVSTGWGMTEIGMPMAAVDPPNSITCGQLSPLYDAKIVDKTGKPVPEGEVGHLYIRQKRPWLLLKGYLGRPEADQESWSGEWFRTGDALRRDNQGYYYFIDRISDYLRVRGNNVSSVELEGEIRLHPDVDDVAAVAVRMQPASCQSSGRNVIAATTEDEIKVLVIRRPGSTLSEAELHGFMKKSLPGYMVPRFIEFVGSLPRTPTGKIRKGAIRSDAGTSLVWDREIDAHMSN
ncbi:MAG: AMP-binding protein [Sphingomonadaceae bacterium]